MTGYSETPLVKQLGIKPETIIYIYNPPEDYFDWLTPFPQKVKVKDNLVGMMDFIHLFVTDIKSFQARFTQAKSCLKKDGMLWVSWPRKSSGVMSELDENTIRSFALRQGLIDIKGYSIDEAWSALKFVHRVL